MADLRRLSAALGLALGLLPFGASSAALSSSAQTSPSAADGLRPLETMVVTASRRDQAQSQVSASLSAVEGEWIELLRPTHISELLHRMPGTWISRGNGQEHLTAVRSPVFTGSGSCGSFYMAEDSIPLRPAGFCNVNQLFEANAEQAERVEVLRGPGTALHGSNALHGVINVLSRAAHPEQRQTELSLGQGPHGYRQLRLSHNQPLGPDHALRASLNTTHDGGYKRHSGYDQHKLSLRHDWQGSGQAVTTALTLTRLEQDTAGYSEGRNAYRDRRLRRHNPNPEAYRNNTALRLYSRWTVDAPGGEWVVTPFLRHQRMDFLQHYLPGLPIEKNGLRSAGWQAARHWRGERLEVALGLDGEYTSAWLRETQSPTHAAGPLFPAGRHYDYEVDSLRGALFGQLDWQPSRRDRFSAGLRLEHQRYDYDNRMIDGSTAADGQPCTVGGQAVPCRYSRPADRKDRFDNHSINLGWIHQLSDHQQLVAQLSRGFRTPEAAELYRLQQGQLTTDLSSERLDNVELGWRWHSEEARIQLTIFDMRKRNVIFQDAERRNLSDGRTRHQGAELDLAWSPARGWLLSAQGSLARHRHTDNAMSTALGQSVPLRHRDIATAPRRMAAAQLGWRPTEATHIELEWVRMGRYWLDLENRHRYPGHSLVHLRLRQQLTPALDVGLRLMNATDRSYAERGDFAFGQYRYFVGEPRSLYADLNLRF